MPNGPIEGEIAWVEGKTMLKTGIAPKMLHVRIRNLSLNQRFIPVVVTILQKHTAGH
jgi:hypothetical protein